MADTSADITQLLNAAQSGDSDAQETAYALVYDELKRCARRQKAFLPGSSLSPTALVSELYLRLSGHHTDRIRNRAHFFALAARETHQFQGMCDALQTPPSHFTESPICSRLTPDGRISLAGMRLITTAGEERSERDMADEAEREAVLRDLFGIDLGGAQLRDSGSRVGASEGSTSP